MRNKFEPDIYQDESLMLGLDEPDIDQMSDIGPDIGMPIDPEGPEHRMPMTDHEGAMAKADLYKMAKYSVKLFKQIEDDDQLESWVQAKITKAADYLASVYHYLEYEMKFSEYGEKLDNAEIYSESKRQQMKEKLNEARNLIRKIKFQDAEKLSEGRNRKEPLNFDTTDINKMNSMSDMTSLREYAKKLIHKSSSRPLKPEKQAYFDSCIEKAKKPEHIIKIFYDMLLKSEGHGTIGSTHSMEPNSYTKKFGEDLNEISDDAKKNYRDAAGRDMKNSHASGKEEKVAKRLRGISKSLKPSKKSNRAVAEEMACNSTPKKAKKSGDEKKNKSDSEMKLKEGKMSKYKPKPAAFEPITGDDAERKEKLKKILPIVARKMENNIVIPMSYRDAEEFAEFVEEMSTEMSGPTIFADDVIDYLESHDMLHTGDMNMEVKESFDDFDSNHESLDTKVLSTNDEDGTCTVEVTASDGRTLTISDCTNPEMSMDEFEWAWGECKAGRGDQYGYKITTKLHELGDETSPDEHNDIISAPDTFKNQFSDEENDVMSAPDPSVAGDEDNDVLSAPSVRQNPDLSRLKSLSGIR